MQLVKQLKLDNSYETHSYQKLENFEQFKSSSTSYQNHFKSISTWNIANQIKLYWNSYWTNLSKQWQLTCTLTNWTYLGRTSINLPIFFIHKSHYTKQIFLYALNKFVYALNCYHVLPFPLHVLPNLPYALASNYVLPFYPSVLPNLPYALARTYVLPFYPEAPSNLP